MLRALYTVMKEVNDKGMMWHLVQPAVYVCGGGGGGMEE